MVYHYFYLLILTAAVCEVLNHKLVILGRVFLYIYLFSFLLDGRADGTRAVGVVPTARIIIYWGKAEYHWTTAHVQSFPANIFVTTPHLWSPSIRDACGKSLPP